MHAASLLQRGILAVLGSDLPEGATFQDNLPPERRRSTLIALDARTGERLSETTLQNAAGWAVVTEEAAIAVGSDAGVAAYHPFDGTLLWAQYTDRLRASRAAVAMPGMLVIREARNRLSILDTIDGEWRAAALTDAGRLDPGFGTIRTQWLGSAFAITTRRGSAVFDTAGTLLGLDARPTAGDVLPAAFAQNAFFTLLLSRKLC